MPAASRQQCSLPGDGWVTGISARSRFASLRFAGPLPKACREAISVQSNRDGPPAILRFYEPRGRSGRAWRRIPRRLEVFRRRMLPRRTSGACSDRECSANGADSPSSTSSDDQVRMMPPGHFEPLGGAGRRKKSASRDAPGPFAELLASPRKNRRSARFAGCPKQHPPWRG